MGDVYSVERGKVEEITVFNGDLSQRLSFIISFSGTVKTLLVGAATLISALILTFD